MPLEVPWSFPSWSYVSAFSNISCQHFFSHTTNSLFKNQVENGSIKLRANHEKNWPSFLYPEGTVYDELELEKGLFHGHVFLRVSLCFFVFFKKFLLHVIFSGFALYIHREILSIYQPSSSIQTFPGRNSRHAESIPWSSHICCSSGKLRYLKLRVLLLIFSHSATTAFLLLKAGIPRIDSSSSISFSTNVLSFSLKIPKTSGPLKPFSI